MSHAGITLEEVGPENLPDRGIGCLTNRKNQGYQMKVEYFRRVK